MPAKDIMKMKRERQAKIEELRTLLETAETRDDSKLTSDEESRYNDLRTEIDRRTSAIEREEHLQSLDTNTYESNEQSADTRSFGEFLHEVRFNPNSNYLQQRELKNGESRDMTMGDGPSAGFLVPEQHDTTIRQVEAQQALFRPRATVIPAGSPPDAAMNLISLDQSGALGVYSGVVVRWLADETAARQDAGDPRIRTIKIEPQEVSGFIDVSDKLLRNSAAAGPLVQKMLRGAIVSSEETAFMTGDGVGKPLGIIGHPSCVSINRNGAATIVYADLVNMLSRNMGNPVWVANRTALPQLMTMVDANGNLIWQPNAREGQPSTLLGLPLLFNQRSPVLGQEGDISLVDLDYYAIKDGSPLAIFMDPYTQKVNGVTRIYAFWNVDGQPMLTTPMLEEDGVTTVSPFVTLN